MSGKYSLDFFFRILNDYFYVFRAFANRASGCVSGPGQNSHVLPFDPHKHATTVAGN
jgi:hypothetical protein